jgi:hypothetical protein
MIPNMMGQIIIIQMFQSTNQNQFPTMLPGYKILVLDVHQTDVGVPNGTGSQPKIMEIYKII